MDISLDRLKHIKAVAVKMRRIVLENLDKFPYTPDEMFALGYVHDIGYAFCDDAREHAHKGGENLQTVIIPSSVQYIWKGTFLYCEKLVIQGYKGTYARIYAKKNKLPFKEIYKNYAG